MRKLLTILLLAPLFVFGQTQINPRQMTGMNAPYPFTETATSGIALGHSYMTGFTLTDTSQNFVHQFYNGISKTYTNYGANSTGFMQALSSFYFRQYAGTVSADNQTNRTILLYMATLNDLAKSKNLPLTKNGLNSAVSTILAQQYLEYSILAADLTHTAGWTSVGSVSTYVSKSGYLSGQTKSPLVCSTTTDSITSLNTRVNKGLAIWYLAGSPAQVYGSFKVYVDNALVATVNTANQADSSHLVTASQSGFTLSNQNRISKCTVLWNVSAGYHKVVIKCAAATATAIDAIGTMADPIICHSAVINHCPYLSSTGYAAFNSTPITNSDVDFANRSIDTAVNNFKSQGYPVSQMATETVLLVPGDIGSDFIHPNLQGATDIANADVIQYNRYATKATMPVAYGVANAFPVYSTGGNLNYTGILKQSANGQQLLVNNAVNDNLTPIQIAGVGTGTNPAIRITDNTNTNIFKIVDNGDITLKNSAQLNFFSNSYWIKAASGLQINANDYVNLSVAGATTARVFAGGVTVGGSSMPASAAFEVLSNTKGQLAVRMATATFAGISSPATGLYAYDTNLNRFTFYDGTAIQLIPTDAITSITKASADLTAQTSPGNITTFTVGSSTATFNISSYLNVTAISTDVIQIQVTYTDENNTSQTVSLVALSAIGNSSYSPVTIRAKNATVITVKTNNTVGGGTETFDAGARITQL